MWNLNIEIQETSAAVACKLNELWHSRLPKLHPSNVWRSKTYVMARMAKVIKEKFPEIEKLISYQDTEVHLGTIYKAANWIPANTSEGGEWSRKSRGRAKVQTAVPKVRWEYSLLKVK